MRIKLRQVCRTLFIRPPNKIIWYQRKFGLEGKHAGSLIDLLCGLHLLLCSVKNREKWDIRRDSFIYLFLVTILKLYRFRC